MEIVCRNCRTPNFLGSNMRAVIHCRNCRARLATRQDILRARLEEEPQHPEQQPQQEQMVPVPFKCPLCYKPLPPYTMARDIHIAKCKEDNEKKKQDQNSKLVKSFNDKLNHKDKRCGSAKR